MSEASKLLREPLMTDKHLQDINENLALIDRAEKEMALAERAGIDQTENKRIMEQYRKKFEAIKQAYFPNR